MPTRKVTDEDGRIWDCKPEDAATAPGRDVNLVCTSPSVAGKLRVTVSWQWARMAERGLARMIAAAARPLPAR